MRNKFDALNEIQGDENRELKFNYKLAFWVLVVANLINVIVHHPIQNMKDEYKCEKCEQVWGFFEEDYDFIEKDYPTVCPLCSIPITQMIKEVYRVEGLRETLRMIFIRIIK